MLTKKQRRYCLIKNPAFNLDVNLEKLKMYNEEVDFLEEVIMRALGTSLDIKTLQFISGGLVNQAVYTDTSKGKLFIKFNEDRPPKMFDAEERGLAMIRENVPELYVPKVVHTGKVANRNVLVMEYLQEQYPNNQFWEKLGYGVAAMHKVNSPNAGLAFDNFNGPLAQKNTPSTDWSNFFFEHRLRAQFGLAFYNQIIPKDYLQKLETLQKAFEKLYTKAVFSLLHGDFWRGNILTGKNQQPCIFDPAVYFGDREVDLATAKLLGGFQDLFFEAYQEKYPLEYGAKERMEIYSLYPLMIQVNLYGSSYLNRIDSILKKYI